MATKKQPLTDSDLAAKHLRVVPTHDPGVVGIRCTRCGHRINVLEDRYRRLDPEEVGCTRCDQGEADE